MAANPIMVSICMCASQKNHLELLDRNSTEAALIWINLEGLLLRTRRSFARGDTRGCSATSA